jgi:hypothetical protein
MTKEEWDVWWPKYWGRLNEDQRFWVFQSEEFQSAIDQENFYLAQEIAFEIAERYGS